LVWKELTKIWTSQQATSMPEKIYSTYETLCMKLCLWQKAQSKFIAHLLCLASPLKLKWYLIHVCKFDVLGFNAYVMHLGNKPINASCGSNTIPFLFFSHNDPSISLYF
jgi:hypothetical protein